MALTAKVLFDSAQIMNSALFGLGDTEIFEVNPWDGDCVEAPGTLYISEEASRHPRSEKACWIQVPHGQSTDAVKRIQTLLSRDYRRSIMLSQLYLQPASNLSKISEISLCARVLGNPMWLLNSALQIISRSPGSPEIQNIVSIRRDISLLTDRPLFLEADDGCAYRRLLCPMRQQGTTCGYLIAFQMQQLLIPQIDEQCIETISEILTGRMQADAAVGRADAIGIFILEILRGQVTDAVAIEQRLKDLHWPHSEKYYVLSVDTGGDYGTSFMAKAISSLLHREIYVMGRYCLAILGCSIENNLSEQDFPELIKFLSSYGLYAGLSNGFLNLTTLRQAFDQSVTAIPLRQRFSEDVRLARYEDLILIHLIDTASKNGVPLQSLCHPLVVNISNYDSEHGTDYLKTLSAYVLNNMSIQRSSDVLFIHRNTMHYRVNQLKEIFHIDFNNARLFMKLRISVSIYSYLGHVKLDNLWGPFY